MDKEWITLINVTFNHAIALNLTVICLFEQLTECHLFTVICDGRWDIWCTVIHNKLKLDPSHWQLSACTTWVKKNHRNMFIFFSDMLRIPMLRTRTEQIVSLEFTNDLLLLVMPWNSFMKTTTISSKEMYWSLPEKGYNLCGRASRQWIKVTIFRSRRTRPTKIPLSRIAPLPDLYCPPRVPATSWLPSLTLHQNPQAEVLLSLVPPLTRCPHPPQTDSRSRTGYPPLRGNNPCPGRGQKSDMYRLKVDSISARNHMKTFLNRSQQHPNEGHLKWTNSVQVWMKIC